MLEVTMLRFAFVSLALSVVLVGCVPATQANAKRYSLIVENQCKGPNQTVYFYINDQYWGVVKGSRIYQDLAAGTYNLRAVGTQAGAITFTRTLQLNQDAVWTLGIGGTPC